MPRKNIRARTETKKTTNEVIKAEKNRNKK